jgi:hypothetical protein
MVCVGMDVHRKRTQVAVNDDSCEEVSAYLVSPITLFTASRR